MDTGAALALSTEPPLKSVLKGSPRSNTSILNAVVWRQILGVSLWNVLIILSIFFFGTSLAKLPDFDNFVSVNRSPPSGYGTAACTADADCSRDGQRYVESQAKLTELTIVFCTFVFLQLSNEINCRKIGQRDYNVFDHFWHNFYFLGILTVTTAVQIVLVEWFPLISRSKSLTVGQWGGCATVGLTPLLIALLLKLTPSSLLSKIPF